MAKDAKRYHVSPRRRLLTGRNFWTTGPIDSIGLRALGEGLWRTDDPATAVVQGRRPVWSRSPCPMIRRRLLVAAGEVEPAA